MDLDIDTMAIRSSDNGDTRPDTLSLAPQDETGLLSDANLDLDTLLNEVVRNGALTLGAKACTVRLLDEETGEMVLRAVYGLSPQFLSKGPIIAAMSVFRELLELCGKEGGYIESLDVRADPRIQYTKEAIAEGIFSLLAVPLLWNEKVIGALAVYTDRPYRFSEHEVQTLQIFARNAAVAIHLAQVHERQLEIERIGRELSIAADIQSKLMPRKAPQIPGIEIAGWNLPCREVGGDFYDFIELPKNNLGIAVGDVSGKGIPAALLMATVRTSLRIQAENVYGMHEVMSRVNRTLSQDTEGEQYATLFYAVLDVRDRLLTYVNAGHNNPLLIRGGTVIPFEVGGVPLGIHPDLAYTYKEQLVKLSRGDLLVIYTDGFIDAVDESGEAFGEERFERVVLNNRHLNPADLVRKLEDEVRSFASIEGDYQDDRTVVVLKVLK